MDLLFRASEHGFKASAFHEKCDKKVDTVVLVRTEFGKTIGGFSHYPWASPFFSSFLNDADRRCFLFSLDLKAKFVPHDDKKLINQDKSSGPSFGNGDLRISDKCNSKSSSTDFPSTYNLDGLDKMEKNQASWCLFSGATTDNRFKVVEYEVFQAFYE